jgi:hypothetical protein
MTRTARDHRRFVRRLGAGRAWLASSRRRRVLLAGGFLLLLGIAIAIAAILLGRSDSPSIAGSPGLPAAYRPGVGIDPIALGEPRARVLAALGGAGRQLFPGSFLFARPAGQIAVAFDRGRVARILATGIGNPFGQRLAAEETTLSSWHVELCQKPARFLLVAPGGHTYFVFRSAAAGLGAVGVSVSPVKPCGSLG